MSATDQRESVSYRFSWLGPGRVPASLDLQRCGWEMDERQEPRTGCIGLIDASDIDSVEWLKALFAYNAEARRFILIVGVRRPHERAALLRTGFGDAVTDAIDIEELGARASRIAEAGDWLPRLRRVGALELDLLARDAYGCGKPLNLNPREFALLWRLTDSPNRAVAKQTLLQDVWRIGFMPTTNSIAVHMSRLRRKLGFAGLKGVIETSPGGYCLRISDRTAEAGPSPQPRTGTDCMQRGMPRSMSAPV